MGNSTSPWTKSVASTAHFPPGGGIENHDRPHHHDRAAERQVEGAAGEDAERPQLYRRPHRREQSGSDDGELLHAGSKAHPHDISGGVGPRLPQPAREEQAADRKGDDIRQVDDEERRTGAVGGGAVAGERKGADPGHEHARADHPPAPLPAGADIVAGVAAHPGKDEPGDDEDEEVEGDGEVFQEHGDRGAAGISRAGAAGTSLSALRFV